MKRVLASLLGLLVAWLALANASAEAIEPPLRACPVYDYDSQHVCAPSAESATERGPPAVHDRHAAYNAVDRWSGGAAARPDRPTPSPIITYDLHALLVQSAGVVMTTLDATPDSSGLLSSFQRSDVAAKSVDDLAEVGFRSDTSHIFRDATGHLAEDTAENRALIKSALDPANLRDTITLKDGTTLQKYFSDLPDGTQAWPEIRNGEITNRGLNVIPR